MTRLTDDLQRSIHRSPDAPAVTDLAGTWTWSQLDTVARAWAGQLTAAGCSPGERVLFMARNGKETIALLWACWSSGFVAVPGNWRLTAKELAGILADCSPVIIAVTDEFRGTVEEAVARSGTNPTLLNLGSQHDLNEGIRSSSGVPEEKALALLMYTAGTTGRPKGVMLTHSSLAWASTIGTRLGMGEESVVLAGLPFFHIGGLGWALFGLTAGAHVVILREPDIDQIVRACSAYGVSHLGLVPTLLLRLLDRVEQSKLNLIVSLVSYGGAPITPELVRRTLNVLGAQLCQMYGLTEMAGVVCILDPGDHTDPNHLSSVGRPIPGVELRLDGGRLDTQEDATVGELVIRCGKAMEGYWGQGWPGDKDGWFHTGDVARIDDDGYVYLLDRLDDMIITGGENVYPSEVESLLASHPAVSEVAVVGVPSEEWGSEVKAVVVTKPPGATELELIQYCRQHIAGYKCPRSVDFVEGLPLSPAGKVLRRVLREGYRSQGGR